MNYADRIIVALDASEDQQISRLLTELKGLSCYIKIGMELFYKKGTPIVEQIKSQGLKVFLDLKLHDIPNTVGKAVKNLCELPIDMLNVHVAGGSEMLKAAVDSLPAKNPPLLIGVTQLTSTSLEMMNQELLIARSVNEVVLHYAHLAKKAGLGGVVASPLEAQILKENLGKDFVVVTPGIRLETDAKQDQKRTATPQEAFHLGADYLVIGRPITQDKNPREKFLNIIQGLQT